MNVNVRCDAGGDPIRFCTGVYGMSKPKHAPLHNSTALVITTCVFFTTGYAADTATAQAGATASSSPELGEIIVTAEKRSERLQDVPVPVATLDPAFLTGSNQLRLEDYFSSVPGLTLQAAGSGQQQIAIRGITTGGLANPSVGITIDDVPFGSSSVLGYGNEFVPDIDPSDLAQIEVLRGPQGALYGASSIGGLLKYQTVDPSTEGYSGRVETDLNSVHNGDSLGYGVRGSVNAPLSDDVAVRVSGFTRRDPGYIDDPATGAKGVNQTNTSGGRVSGIWKPSGDLSIKLSAMMQDTTGHGSSLVQPQLGDLAQELVPNTGWYNQQFRQYTMSINANIGPMRFTSVTGYGTTSIYQILDVSPNYGGFATQFFGVPTASQLQALSTEKFTQELRATTTFANRIDMLVGAFYTHETTAADYKDYAVSNVGAIEGTMIDINFPSKFSEIAGFTDVTVHFTDALDVQIGGRFSDIRQIYNEVDTGVLDEVFYGLPSPAVVPTIYTTDRPATLLFTPRYKLSPDLMVYARIASGYRAGAPNFEATLFKQGIPHTFSSDKTQNFELGVKGDAFNRRLSFDASIYRINWHDVQIQLIDPVTLFLYYANGGNAKSQGVELSLQLRPLEGMTISAWGTYSDAVLTEALPPQASAEAEAGARLPYSSRSSGSLSLDQKVTITGQWQGTAGGALSYIGRREDIFAAAGGTRNSMPGYTKIDLHAGVKYDTWNLNLFVNNLADRRGVLGLTPYGSISLPNLIPPRTVGLSLAKSF